MIDALYRHANAIAQAELDRTLGKLPLDAAGRQQVEDLARRLVQKLLHGPVSQLKQSHAPADGDAGPPGPAYLHAVEKLFGLAVPAVGEDVKLPYADDDAAG